MAELGAHPPQHGTVFAQATQRQLEPLARLVLVGDAERRGPAQHGQHGGAALAEQVPQDDRGQLDADRVAVADLLAHDPGHASLEGGDQLGGDGERAERGGVGLGRDRVGEQAGAVVGAEDHDLLDRLGRGQAAEGLVEQGADALEGAVRDEGTDHRGARAPPRRPRRPSGNRALEHGGELAGVGRVDQTREGGGPHGGVEEVGVGLGPALAEGVVVEQALVAELVDERGEIGHGNIERLRHQQRLAQLGQGSGAVEQVEHGPQLGIDRERLGEAERIAHHHEIFAAAVVLDAIHFAKLGPVHETPRVHHVLVMAAVLGLAGPPASEPEPEATGDAIGIVWHDQATVAPAIQQRLVRGLGREGAPAVVTDARALARARMAVELAPERAARSIGWSSMLADATTAYRAGELEPARARIAALLEAVRADPVVPGAARLAWRAQVLRGQLAYTAGDTAEQDAALAAAVALDPEARPSTRELPPAVVEAYSERRAAVMAGAARWPTLEVRVPEAGPFALEIDGVPGRRAVPPGEHLVVVRRPGMDPVGAVVSTEVPWTAPAGVERLVQDLPPTSAQAQEICDRIDVDWLVLARVRAGRLGLQRYTCGEGFSSAWFEGREGWAPGLAHVATVSRAGLVDDPVLHLRRPWPAVPPAVLPPPQVATDGGSPTRRGARLRRAWPWVLITGAIAGGVTVGVLLGTDDAADLSIDGNGFLGR